MSNLLLKNIKQIFKMKSQTPASLWIENGIIRAIAPLNEIHRDFPESSGPKVKTIDCSNLLLLPGFIDSHTHLLFFGSRENELYQRAAGRSYMEIMESGGGIYSTVNSVQKASDEELLQNGLKFLDKALELGTTTIEVKSGYGLDTGNELRMLQIIKKLDGLHSVDVIPTFLTHTVPRSWERSKYIETVAREMIPAFREYAAWYDIFLEKGVFNLKESELLLRTALNEGYHLGIHTNQIHDIGGVGIAAELGCRHVNHLEVLNDEDAGLIVNTPDLFPVFLPAAEAFVFSERIGQIHKLMSIPDRLVLSTDFNPGSSPVLSPCMIMTMAILRYRISNYQLLIEAFTENPARMLFLNDRGVIEAGRKADLLLMPYDNFEQIPYFGTFPSIEWVIKNGEVVFPMR